MTKIEIVKSIMQQHMMDGQLMLPKQTLAKLIYEQNPGVWPNVDAVRKQIRAATGSMGSNSYAKKHSENMPGKSTIEEGLKKFGLYTKLPVRKDVVLPPGKYLVMSDIHFPEHDPLAIQASLEYGKEKGITGIVLNGDIIDMYMVSRFLQETKRPSIREELIMTRSFFQLLREEFPTLPIWYKFGNHEERMRHYLLSNARAIEDLDGITLEEQLHLKKYDIKVVFRERIKAGKLDILHGHEFQKSIMAPVNPARGAFMRAKSSLLIGHHHQTSSHHENNLKGDEIVCFSTGCHCTLTPEYNPYGYIKQNHGGAIVTVLPNRNFHVENYRIIEGRVY
jgi:predicted phosphodiesterase